MVACIVGVPIAAVRGRLDWALAFTAIVALECLVLALNRWRCPMTDWALRYTEQRGDNFDIYLPNWLARHNKRIFGALFVGAELVMLWRWLAA